MASDERERLIEHLKRLHLRHAWQNLDEHLRQATQLKLGHLGFLARVAEAEVLARQQTAVERRLGAADFPEMLRLEDYDFKLQPALDRKQIMDLAELGFVDRAEAVIFIGPSGVGKTHLAIALGIQACQANYHVRFVRAYPLLRSLYAALADDTLEDVLYELCQPTVLIIDELGNTTRKEDHDYAGVFFELVARRYRRGTIILSISASSSGPPRSAPPRRSLQPSIGSSTPPT